MNRELRQQLNDLDFPILTHQQLKFLDEVGLALEDTILKIPFADDYLHDEEVEIFCKISVMEENLKTIIHNLKVGKSAKIRFVKGFSKWKKVRDECIEKLKEISVSINTDRRNCNISKLVGYSTSFLGGVLTLASAIALIPTLGATTPLLISGAALTGAGCATTVGTSVTEVVLLKAKIEQAQELIAKDKICFQDLGEWLDRATELQRALTEILSLCPHEEIINEVKYLVERASEIPRHYERMRAIENSLNRIIALGETVFTGVPLRMIAIIITILVVVFQLLMNTKNRLVFDVALLTIRGLSALGLLLDDVVDMVGLVNLFSKNAAVAGNLAKSITRGAISVFGMALDVTGIIFTSIDVSKGSLSPDAEKLAKAADELKEEAEKLEKIYNDLH